MRKPIAPVVALLLGAVIAGSASAQTIQGSAAAGEKKAATCNGCHSIPGYQASFPEVHHVPMLAGQNAKYLQNSLAAYKSGDRKHPTMKAVAASLSEQDMADLAAYFSTLAKVPPVDAKVSHEPPAEVAALLQKGNCVSCHGSNFSKPLDPSYPKLAGQHADYLYVALKAYQTHDNPQIGRANPIMGGMAAPFSHVQLKQIAQYIGSLDSELRVVPVARFK